MHRVRMEGLPFKGSSHQFVGADQGDTNVSVFLFNGAPGAGDILVVKAGEVHRFTNTGDGPLVQLDVHLSPRFIQETLPSRGIRARDDLAAYLAGDSWAARASSCAASVTRPERRISSA